MTAEAHTDLDRAAEVFGRICDVIERNHHGWSLDREPDEAPLLHTSAEARAAARRILEILGISATMSGVSDATPEEQASTAEHLARWSAIPGSGTSGGDTPRAH